MAANGVRTVEDKAAALKAKRDAERALGAQIDRQINSADAATHGCGFCSLFGRWRRRGDGAGAAQPTLANGAVGAALFGVSKAKADPNSALAAAVQAMQARVEQLETRVSEARAEAQRLHKAGQKAAALRALKKAKGLERQLSATQSSMDAVEQQVDMMEQATMQRAVATALSSTAKDMKKDKALLAKAEGAVEEAQEARDLAEDLGTVMSELGASSAQDFDDEELMAELEQMMEPPGGPSAAVKESADAEMSSALEIEALELKIGQHEEAEVVRKAFPLPGKKTPRGGEEKQGLLAVAQCA
jgi:ATP-dependent Lon protease